MNGLNEDNMETDDSDDDSALEEADSDLESEMEEIFGDMDNDDVHDAIDKFKENNSKREEKL